MPKTAQMLENLEKYRNREYTANEAIADLATEIRGLIDDRLALNTAIEKMKLGLLIAGKNRAWTITRPVCDVTDTATGDIIPATWGELWRELRRRSGLEPRAFVMAFARAADIEIPDVLRPAVTWNPDNGPAPAGWTAPEGDRRWKKTGDFGQMAAVAAELLEKTREAEIREFEASLTPEKMELLCPFFRNSPDDFFPEGKFSPALLADKFVSGFKPIHDGTAFFLYRAQRGVWEEINENFIAQKITAFLGDRAKAAHVRDALYLAQTRTYIDTDAVRPSKHLVNLANGVLDIRTRELMPHDRRFFFTNAVPIEYDTTAKCPRWLRFLAEVFPDDPGKATTLQDFAGYCLYPQLPIHEALFLIGPGGNGKSTFLNTLSKLIGRHNISALDPHQFSDKFLVGMLRGALLNACGDIDARAPIHGATFKAAISGDLIQADVKYKTPITFRPFAKHVFSMNEIPNLTDKTDGMTRRLIVVRFNQRFSGRAEDRTLEKKLTDELPGILNWALAGLARVIETNTLFKTETMASDKEAFATLSDPVRMFTDELCVLGPKLQTQKTTLYDAFSRFCDQSKLKPVSKRLFYEQLPDRFPTVTESKSYGTRYFNGIGFIEE